MDPTQFLLKQNQLLKRKLDHLKRSRSLLSQKLQCQKVHNDIINPEDVHTEQISEDLQKKIQETQEQNVELVNKIKNYELKFNEQQDTIAKLQSCVDDLSISQTTNYSRTSNHYYTTIQNTVPSERLPPQLNSIKSDFSFNSDKRGSLKKLSLLSSVHASMNPYRLPQ